MTTTTLRYCVCVLALVATSGCDSASGGVSGGNVYCGVTTFTGQAFVQGDLIPWNWTRDGCITVRNRNGGIELHEAITIDRSNGRCLYEGTDSSVSGTCNFLEPGRDSSQLWSYSQTPLTMAVAGEQLTLSGELVGATFEDGTLVYHIGEVAFGGTLAPDSTPEDVTNDGPPNCDLPTCQTGDWRMVSESTTGASGSCQPSIDTFLRDRPAEFTLMDAYRVDNNGETLYAPDLDACAIHWALDGNPNVISRFTLTDGAVTARKVERYVNEASQLVTCTLVFEADLTPCQQ